MRSMTRRMYALMLALLMTLPLSPALAGPAPSPAAEIVVPEGLADLRSRAPEGTFLKPGEEPVAAEDSFKSANVSVTIRRVRDEEARADVVIADIWVASVAYLRRGFALGEWNSEMRSIRTMAPENGAIAAMTGDYANMLSAGLVVANGEVLRDSPNSKRDICLVLKDGRMVTYEKGEMVVEEALGLGVWHSFLFGPALLKDGKAIGKFSHPLAGRNPRSVLAYFEPGHYAFVLVDGRSSKSKGMTLEQVSLFLQELGVKAAYNLDGGQSALLWFNGGVINDPYKGGRRLMDIVFVPQQ